MTDDKGKRRIEKPRRDHPPTDKQPKERLSDGPEGLIVAESDALLLTGT